MGSLFSININEPSELVVRPKNKSQTKSPSQQKKKSKLDPKSMGKDIDSEEEEELRKIKVREMIPWQEKIDAEHLRNELQKTLNTLSGTDFDMKVCWLTQLRVETKVARVIPEFAKRATLTKMHLPKRFKTSTNPTATCFNFLLLDEGLEDAFHRLICSFVPIDASHPNTFVLKVWDKAKAYTYEFSDHTTLNSYDGRRLMIPPFWKMARRVFAHHALCAYHFHAFQKATFEASGETLQWLEDVYKTSVREEVLLL